MKQEKSKSLEKKIVKADGALVFADKATLNIASFTTYHNWDLETLPKSNRKPSVINKKPLGNKSELINSITCRICLFRYKLPGATKDATNSRHE